MLDALHFGLDALGLALDGHVLALVFLYEMVLGPLPSYARTSFIGVAPLGLAFKGVASSNDSNSIRESEMGGRSITMTTPLSVFRLFSYHFRASSLSDLITITLPLRSGSFIFMWRVEDPTLNLLRAGLPNKMLKAELALTSKYRMLSVLDVAPSVNVVLSSR